MYVLGHLGFGAALSIPFRGRGSEQLSLWWVLLGAILPDLIDKPLFFFFDFDWVTGTRTLGHTALFALSAAAVAFFTKNKTVAAIAVGVMTHIFFDHLNDYLAMSIFHDPKVTYGFGLDSPRVTGLFYPILGLQFPGYPFENSGEHLMAFQRPSIVWAEITGMILLIREIKKYKKVRDALPV